MKADLSTMRKPAADFHIKQRTLVTFWQPCTWLVDHRQ